MSETEVDVRLKPKAHTASPAAAPTISNQAPPTQTPPNAAPAMSSQDQAELAAYRSQAARNEAARHGWKPITIWYAFWAVMLAIGAISTLASGSVGAFFFALIASGLSAKYSHYLYHGGRRRVWFIIW